MTHTHRTEAAAIATIHDVMESAGAVVTVRREPIPPADDRRTSVPTVVVQYKGQTFRTQRPTFSRCLDAAVAWLRPRLEE